MLTDDSIMVKSNFVKVFGDTPTNRLWEFLIDSRGIFDYSMTDICNATGIAWNTLKEIFPSFIKNSIVTETRNIGRATMYKLNDSNPKVIFMVNIYKAINMLFAHGKDFKLNIKIINVGQQEDTIEMGLSRRALPIRIDS